MDISAIKQQLLILVKEITGQDSKEIIQLPQSGSSRIYFRLKTDSQNYIGAFNNDLKENEAFFSFTKTFKQLDINVPEILTIASDRKHYLLSDLGNETLFSALKNNKRTEKGKSNLCYIKKSLLALIDIQINGGNNIDFTKCYPRDKFDAQSIQWDLNYFKYEFLKLANISFDEQKLENDFQTIITYLQEVPSEYFMFRDFQSRNIMIIDDEPWFIDYQGGRKGPLQYDVASILYSPKTRLNKIQQEALLDFYIEQLSQKISIDTNLFKNQYYGFVLIRILQALGAYGYRGIFEKKSNFRNSIPVAIKNLSQLFIDKKRAIELPEIEAIVNYLSVSDLAKPYCIPTDKLTVRITSFSYKKGIPDDPSENGGGFAFDCRGLPNPGRYDEYRTFNGKDSKVQAYLEEYPQVLNFQENVREIVKISLEEYIKKGFNHLCVNFGCTGGQHRSVYNAEKFSEWVTNNFPVNVVLIHTEMMNWKKHE